MPPRPTNSIFSSIYAPKPDRIERVGAADTAAGWVGQHTICYWHHPEDHVQSAADAGVLPAKPTVSASRVTIAERAMMALFVENLDAPKFQDSYERLSD